MSNIRNIALEGGGVKGIAYVGFFQKLQEQKKEFTHLERVSGTSAGAIFGMLLALGYSIDEMNAIYADLDFSKFEDSPGRILADLKELNRNFGFYKGDVLHSFIKGLIKAKTGAENTTFAELKAMQAKENVKDFYAIATRMFFRHNIPAYETIVFSHETTPNTPIADAVRASASIPVFFASVMLKKSSDGSYLINPEEGDVFIDGGDSNNYPIRIFDQVRYQTDSKDTKSTKYKYNKDTLGIRLDDINEIDKIENKTDTSQEERIQNFQQYVSAILYTVGHNQDDDLINTRDPARSISIDCTGINGTNFNITQQQKQQLINAGAKAAEEYLKKQQPLQDKIISKPGAPVIFPAKNRQDELTEVDSASQKCIDSCAIL
jgi:NTE family protein